MIFEPFSPSAETRGFDCGDRRLNDFVRSQAPKFGRLRLGVTYLVRDESLLVGYVTLSNSLLVIDDKASPNVFIDLEGLRLRQIPALLVGRLALQKQFQGDKQRNYGKRIVKRVVGYAKSQSRQVGLRLIVVDSYPIPKVVKFYEDCGFQHVRSQASEEDHPNVTMFFDLGALGVP